MAHSFFRAHGPTESWRVAPRSIGVLAILPLFAACVAYEPAPVDVQRILADLGTRTWEAEVPGDVPEGGRAAPAELAAFAVIHNPSLQALRSRIGVERALLVEAGLFSDPEFGWDAMDVLASRIANGTSSDENVLSGFGLSVELPRPGELGAKKGAARWRVEEARRRVVQVEWRLAREVFVSCEDLFEARRLLAQNRELEQVAETTRDYFERAKEAGAATAIQANLALGELLAIRAERLSLEGRLRDARHRLNALLGLPPATEVPVGPAGAERPEPAGGETAGVAELVERSLSRRPDLAVLLATYAAAEEEVRLEVTRQFPLIAVGTGLSLRPGLFTRFNRPAIETALARRETLRREIETRVHEVRREIEAAHAALAEARRELDYLESHLLPNAEESLRLAGEAFDAGEVTFLEILALQRALVAARTRTTEARAEFLRRHWRLLAASGALLGSADDASGPDDERATTER